MPTLTELEPFDFGPPRDDDGEDLPLAPSEQGSPLGPMLQPGQAADIMSQVGVEPPQQPYQPPQMPPALARQAAEAQRVGDAYRSNPANRQREPFGSAAAYMAGLGPDGQPQQPQQPDGPQWPPAAAQPPADGVPGLGDPRVRERLQQLLQARQAAAPTPAQPAQAGRRMTPEDMLLRRGQQPAERPVVPGELPRDDDEEAPYDFTGADWADGFRRVLHALGSGLLASTGRQAPQFQTIRSGIEARLRRDEDRAVAQEQRDAQMGLQRERLDMQREQMDAQREDRALDREDRAADRDLRQQLSERQMQLAEQRGNMTLEMSRAQLRRIQDDRERERAADNPASEPSRTARLALRTALAGYPAEARQRLAEQMGVEDLDAALGPDGTLSQRAADTLMRSMPSMFRDTTNRRGGGGGGGGGAAAQQALASRAEVAGLTADQVASYGRDRRRLLAEIERREGEVRRGEAQADRAGQGRELLPGIYGASYVGADEARSFRQGFADSGAAMDAVTALEGIGQRYGAAAVIDPRVQSEIAPYIMTLRGIATQLQNTGTINEGEAPIINAALPDPTSWRGRTIRDLDAAIRAWRSALENRIVRRAQALGVSDEQQLRQIRSQLRQLVETPGGPRRGGGAQRGQPAADTVRVRHPDGRTGTIPRSNLERARQAGFEDVR